MLERLEPDSGYEPLRQCTLGEILRSSASAMGEDVMTSSFIEKLRALMAKSYFLLPRYNLSC
jgi:hypothetical protein